MRYWLKPWPRAGKSTEDVCKDLRVFYQFPDWQWKFWTCRETHACRRSSYVSGFRVCQCHIGPLHVSGLQSLPMSYWASIMLFQNFFAVTVIYTPCLHEFSTTYREMLLKLQTGTSSWSGSEWSNYYVVVRRRARAKYEEWARNRVESTTQPTQPASGTRRILLGFCTLLKTLSDFDIHSLFWFHLVSAFKPRETWPSRRFTNPILFWKLKSVSGTSSRDRKTVILFSCGFDRWEHGRETVAARCASLNDWSLCAYETRH